MDRRTWTDDQLRSAVATATTWKAVAAALGLAQSSTPRLKRHVRRLGLKTSHFTGKRRWSDSDLRSAVDACATWQELLERLSISDTSETRLYVKGHAARLGLDLSKINGRLGLPGSTVEVLRRAPDLVTNLRVAAESIAAAWFRLRGFPVAFPDEQQPYDLLVNLPGGVERVQVKSGAYQGPHGTWRVEVGRRPHALDSTAGKEPYDPDVIDRFFVVDGDGSLYLIPSAVLAGRRAISVGAYREFQVGSAASLLRGGPLSTGELIQPLDVGDSPESPGVGRGKNVRTWSDNDLTSVVASQRSWRGVARALGLSEGSDTNGVRRRASQLGLDTSHFSQKRLPWPENDLRNAIAESTSWSGVMRQLGLSETSSFRLALKGRARQLGVDTCHLDDRKAPHPSVVDLLNASVELAQLSMAAERIAIAWSRS